MESFLRILKKAIPSSVFRLFQPAYHFVLALLAWSIYRNPSKEMIVVGVTGTKGKSSVVEILNALFEQAGFQTAVAGTIRFKVGDETEPNQYKMTVPGRFFLQKFLRRAAQADCQYVFLELTSEAAKQYRHLGIELDALIVSNLQKEHIESHGSFEKYREAKLRLKTRLERSKKLPRFLILNRDDTALEPFFELEEKSPVQVLTYSLADAKPFATNTRGSLMTVEGVSIHSPLLGEFNIMNMLAAIAFAKTQGFTVEQLKPVLERFSDIKGRAQKIDKGQKFIAVVDYAHTPDSLVALYRAFGKQRKICVLGNTGGGRDTWKRPEMGRIAEEYCDTIFLTNEDPYDENPRDIVDQMAAGMVEKKPHIILDRRKAIRQALMEAKEKDAVLITGKGTDPFIMGPNGTKEVWSDALVVEEELNRLLGKE